MLQGHNATILTYGDIGAAVCRQLWGFSSAPGGVVGVLEVVSPIEAGG